MSRLHWFWRWWNNGRHEQDGHQLAFNRAFAGNSRSRLGGLGCITVRDLLAVAGGKERIRFYLNNYRPNFAQPTHLGKFIAACTPLKQKHYQQLVASLLFHYVLGRSVAGRTYQLSPLSVRYDSSTPKYDCSVATKLGSHRNGLRWLQQDIITCQKPAPDIYQYVLKWVYQRKIA